MNRQISRRHFGKGMAAVAGAAWWASRGQWVGAADPIEKVRIACVGQGGRGGEHVSQFGKMSDVEIVALCDVDSRHAATGVNNVKKITGKEPQVFQDLRKLLEMKELDAISIATPNHWHSLQAIWALQAGKDVYVEKPVCHNALEGRIMVDTAKKNGRIISSGHHVRSFTQVNKAFEYLGSGKLGKLKLVRGLCYKRRQSIGHKADAPVPMGVDYNLWLGPAPEKPFNPNRFHYEWHWNWDYGNGDLGNQGVHQVDIGRWGLGREFPKRVFSVGGRYGYKDDGQTPNTMITYYDYGDIPFIFEVRGLVTPKLKTVDQGNIYECENGYLVVEAGGKCTAFDKDNKQIETFKGGGNQFRNFIEAVKSRKAESINGKINEAFISAAMVHLGNASYRSGVEQPFAKKEVIESLPGLGETFERFEKHLQENKVDTSMEQLDVGPVLDFDSAKERFTNNDKANTFLTDEWRGYRAPFTLPESA